LPVVGPFEVTIYRGRLGDSAVEVAQTLTVGSSDWQTVNVRLPDTDRYFYVPRDPRARAQPHGLVSADLDRATRGTAQKLAATSINSFSAAPSRPLFSSPGLVADLSWLIEYPFLISPV